MCHTGMYLLVRNNIRVFFVTESSFEYDNSRGSILCDYLGTLYTR